MYKNFSSSSHQLILLVQDVTVIFRRRGGDDLEQNHRVWLTTVKSSPDIIEMAFCPITDLLDEIPVKEHLTRTIGLYLECKSTYPLCKMI